MHELTTDAIWKNRMEQIDSIVDDIRFPDVDNFVDQDEEWCEVDIGGKIRRIRFHDYSDVFRVPGLYEELFYGNLKCCSPSYIVKLLDSVMSENGENLDELKVLDVGAGNGMVGDELKALGVPTVVGIDIIPAARDAALRDRPDVYDDYRIADLTDLPEEEEKRLRRINANCLALVAALGFGDIPPMAFAKVLDLIAVSGWLAFNIKENFLCEQDESGFSRMIRKLNREGFIQTHCYRRYQHRVSITGEPLYYVAVIARKLKDLDDELLESIEQQ